MSKETTLVTPREQRFADIGIDVPRSPKKDTDIDIPRSPRNEFNPKLSAIPEIKESMATMKLMESKEFKITRSSQVLLGMP